MKKRANITFAVFATLLVICCGAVLINTAATSRYNSKTEYMRIRNRYIAECGIDTAIGLFVNYLENRDFEIAYFKDEYDDCCVIDDDLSPYLLDEIYKSTSEETEIDIVSKETENYLTSLGYIEYAKSGDISLAVHTLMQPEKFKLSQMCEEPDFLISQRNENAKSKLRPIYLSVSSKYLNGEVLCSVKIDNLYAVRKNFTELDAKDRGSIEAYIDVSDVTVEYESYQNFGGVGN